MAAIPPDEAKKAYATVQEVLKSGQPAQAQAIISKFGHDYHLILCDLAEIARSWILALEQAQRGEFGNALNIIENIDYRHYPPLLDLVDDWDRVRGSFQAKKEALKTAELEKNRSEVVRLATELLVMAPLYSPAKDALARITESPTEETFIHNAPKPSPKKEPLTADQETDRFLCWVDNVGGYLLCLGSELKLGRATSDVDIDIPIYSDISRHHATLQRDREGGFLLTAIRPTFVNCKQITRTLLKDGDEIALGSGCKLSFRKPLKVSGTALLKLTSHHRLPMSLDGVILMADACLLGDSSEVHIPVADLKSPVALVRRNDHLALQCQGSYRVNDISCSGRTPLPLTARIQGEDFQIAVEPVSANFINGK